MKQYDLFGNEVEVPDEEEITNNKITRKQRFRMKNGYLQGKQCRSCWHHFYVEYNGKRIYKCEKLGNTSSAATDIRLSDVACSLYEEEE